MGDENVCEIKELKGDGEGREEVVEAEGLRFGTERREVNMGKRRKGKEMKMAVWRRTRTRRQRGRQNRRSRIDIRNRNERSR